VERSSRKGTREFFFSKFFMTFNPQPKVDTLDKLNTLKEKKKNAWQKKRSEKKNLKSLKKLGELTYRPLIQTRAPKAQVPGYVRGVWGSIALESGEWTLCLACLESGHAEKMYKQGKAGKVDLHNHADCWHHVMGRGYRREDTVYNSILNLCPVNNWNCHMGNNHSRVKNNENLLVAVFRFMKIAVEQGHYVWREKDAVFYKTYAEIYKRHGCYFQSSATMQKKMPRFEYLQNVLIPAF